MRLIRGISRTRPHFGARRPIFHVIENSLVIIRIPFFTFPAHAMTVLSTAPYSAQGNIGAFPRIKGTLILKTMCRRMPGYRPNLFAVWVAIHHVNMGAIQPPLVSPPSPHAVVSPGPHPISLSWKRCCFGANSQMPHGRQAVSQGGNIVYSCGTMFTNATLPECRNPSISGYSLVLPMECPICISTRIPDWLPG